MDGASPDDGGGVPDADTMTEIDSAPRPPPTSCDTDSDCDDGFGCTLDSCVTGVCHFTSDDSLCGALERCDLRRGCIDDCGDVFCNLLPPACGCPDGDACYFVNPGSRICAPAGTLGVLQPCGGSNACSPGLACLPILAGTSSDLLCQEVCTSDSDCSAGASCSGPTIEEGIGTQLCGHVCDPVTSDPCPGGLACRVLSDGESTVCGGAGSGGQGDPCADTGDCRAGFACGNDASGETVCLRLCDVASASCPSGTMCRTLTTPVVIRGAELGLCA
jgi:hypothetical protein